MTAELKKFKTVYKCVNEAQEIVYVTVDCYGPNIPEESEDNIAMLIDIAKEEFIRLNVIPVNVEGIDYE